MAGFHQTLAGAVCGQPLPKLRPKYVALLAKRYVLNRSSQVFWDPLPVVPVPLLRPDPDITLDLQAAVGSCFDLVGYEHRLDYAKEPPLPSLNPGDAA